MTKVQLKVVHEITRTVKPITVPKEELGREPLMVQTCLIMANSGKHRSFIVQHSGVSPTTLRAWETGKTKRPQASTLRMVLRACGYDLVIQRLR